MDEHQLLDELEIDRAVRNLTARYCDAVASFDVDLFASLWTADADWVVAGARTTSGRERIVRLFSRLRSDYLLCTQELMSGSVTPVVGASPRAADAHWQIREFQWKADTAVSCVMGVYRDHVVFDDDQWRFARRQFDVLYRGPVDLTGTVTPPRADPPVL